MQQMGLDTLRKCHNAVALVYEGKHSLKAAAKEVGISSQTLYLYVDDYLTEYEKKLLRSISQKISVQK